jgi:serine/threonine protein kinase/tetratricopeptide (TPR) repeat protein
MLEAAAMGTLPKGTRLAVEGHLDACAACAEVVAELARVYGSEAPSVPAMTEPATHPPSYGPGAAYRDTQPGATVVGRYRLGRQIGAGGMGVVYEAHDPELQRRVAVKLLHGGLRGDAAAFRAHLLREARAMAQLAHPNVVMVHDVGQVGERVFLAMELVEGTTMREWLATKPKYDAIIDMFLQAGAGLMAAHKIGLVHRDFKPDNVLIADGRARVTDFGLARPLELAATDGPSPVAAALDVSLAQTRPGALVGTPAYMSPEQLRGETADARSDQFSFCVALYEALVGRRPFAGASFAELSRNVLEGRWTVIVPGLWPAVRRVLRRGLATHPHQRYPSMAPLLAELKEPSRAKMAPFIALGGVAVGGVAVALVSLFAKPEEPAATPASETPAAIVRASICELDGIGDAWTPSRRDAVIEQVQRGVFGKDGPPATAAALDAWSERWIAERRKACTGDVSPSRLACLEGERDRFAALVTELGDADSIEAAHALEAASLLPVPDHCGVEARLQRIPAAPSDSQLAAKVALARREIATARAQIDLAAKDAVQTATAAVTAAEATAFAPAMAEARLALGLAQRRAGDPDAAAPTLESAVEAATEGAHPDVTTEAALALVEIEGARRMRTAAAEKWIRIVQADVDAFDDTVLAHTLALHRVAIARAVAEFQDARTVAEEALQLRPKHLESQLAAARALLEADEAAGSLEHAGKALAIAEESFPEKDYRRARVHAAIGHALLALDQPEKALASFETARKLRIYPREYDEDIDEMLADIARARALAAVGRGPEAEEAFAEATREWPEWQENAEVMGQHALWLHAQGRRDEAVKKIRDALAYLEARVGVDDPRLVETLRRVGAIETNLVAAEAALQRAGTLLEQVEYGPLWGLVHETRADLRLRQGDTTGALAELDDAYVTLSSAFGVYGRRTRSNVRRRADLAWELGQKDYAARLYDSIAKEVAEAYGPTHPETMLVAERAQSVSR